MVLILYYGLLGPGEDVLERDVVVEHGVEHRPGLPGHLRVPGGQGPAHIHLTHGILLALQCSIPAYKVANLNLLAFIDS